LQTKHKDLPTSDLASRIVVGLGGFDGCIKRAQPPASIHKTMQCAHHDGPCPHLHGCMPIRRAAVQIVPPGA